MEGVIAFSARFSVNRAMDGHKKRSIQYNFLCFFGFELLVYLILVVQKTKKIQAVYTLYLKKIWAG